MSTKPMKTTLKTRRYKVRYARLVVMQTVIAAVPANGNPDEPKDLLDDGRLPGIFHGIPTRSIGSHIKEVQKYPQVWMVEPCTPTRQPAASTNPHTELLATVELLACELSSRVPAKYRATHPALVKARAVLAKVAPRKNP